MGGARALRRHLCALVVAGAASSCSVPMKDVDVTDDRRGEGRKPSPESDRGTADQAATDGSSPSSDCVDSSPPLAPAGVLARRLVRFLWAEDEAPAALVGRLARADSPEAVMNVARDLLADERARQGVASFIVNWLRLHDLPEIEAPRGALSDDVLRAMRDEAPAFAAHVIFDGDALYKTLLTAPFTFMNEPLSQHYGVDSVSGSSMRRVSYDTPERAGILGGAGVLTRFSGAMDPPWPARRYRLVYETLLCDAPAVQAHSPDVRRDPSLPIREEISRLTAEASCQACHATVDPVGFTFLKLDAFGRFREADDEGRPFDTSADIPAGMGISEPLRATGQPDLVEQLAGRPEVRRCFVARLLSHAVDPAPLPSSEPVEIDSALECSIDEAHASFEASGGDLRELLVAVTGTPAFLSPD